MSHVRAVTIPRYAVLDGAKRSVKFPVSLLFEEPVSQENWTLLSKLGMTH
jgi:hypothetical protein